MHWVIKKRQESPWVVHLLIVIITQIMVTCFIRRIDSYGVGGYVFLANFTNMIHHRAELVYVFTIDFGQENTINNS